MQSGESSSGAAGVADERTVDPVIASGEEVREVVVAEKLAGEIVEVLKSG
jgi:hypothetical protein